MTYLKHQKQRAYRLFLGALTLACLFTSVSSAQVDGMTAAKAPATPTLITPPVGNSLFLVGHATGTQGYVCLPTAVGASTASWTVKGARPEATLFQSFLGLNFQIITHFLSPDT